MASLCLLLALTAMARGAPGVLVTTVQPVAGSLPERLEAYGAVRPADDATESLSLLQAGRVERILRVAGERVQKGTPILQWQASAAARQGWEQARTALALAQQERAHAALLLDRHLGTRDQLDQASKALADAQATVDALQREGADRPVQTVAAPFDGILVSVPVATGDQVATGAPLAVVVRSDGIVVTVGVDPEQLAGLHAGQAATVRPLGGGPLLPATVRRVQAVLDPRTRLVDVDLAVAAGALLPGRDMRSEIALGTASGWLVPHQAVLEDPAGTYLFQVEGGRAVMVRVAVRDVDGDTDLVTGPLVASRPIVRTGGSQLGDGALLREAPGR